MAANIEQHIITVDIDATTEQWIKDRLAEGYVITHIVNMAPVSNKLLIIYATPDLQPQQ